MVAWKDGCTQSTDEETFVHAKQIATILFVGYKVFLVSRVLA